MSNENYYSGLYSLGLFLLISTIFMGVFIIIIVATNDYIFYYFYDSASFMVASNLLPAGILTNLESMATSFLNILGFMDKFWLIMFLVFVISYLRNSYFARREGFVSIFGFISFGMMMVLFALNLLVEYNTAIHNIFFNVILQNLNIDLTFFNLYLTNFQVVNLVLIVMGLIINFVPFDLLQYNNRKKIDTLEELA